MNKNKSENVIGEQQQANHHELKKARKQCFSKAQVRKGHEDARVICGIENDVIQMIIFYKNNNQNNAKCLL